jgi:hypothetical protein
MGARVLGTVAARRGTILPIKAAWPIDATGRLAAASLVIAGQGCAACPTPRRCEAVVWTPLRARSFES